LCGNIYDFDFRTYFQLTSADNYAQQLSVRTFREEGREEVEVRFLAHDSGERKLTSSSFHIASKVLQALELDVTTFARGGYF